MHRNAVDDRSDPTEWRLVRGKERDHRPSIVDRFDLEIGRYDGVDVFMLDRLPRQLDTTHGERAGNVGVVGHAETDVFHKV